MSEPGQEDVPPQRVLAASLVVDHTLIPRGLDPLHVRALSDALLSGDTLPPVVVDLASRRIVSGLHRHEAHLRVYGKDAEIDVIFREYASDTELWEAAVADNGTHGKPFTPFEQRLLVSRAEELGVPLERMASLLHVPVKNLQKRTVVGYAVERRPTGDVVRRSVPLKRSLQHLNGLDLTAAQQRANQFVSGMTPRFHARQLNIFLADPTLLEPSLADSAAIEDLLALHDRLGRLIQGGFVVRLSDPGGPLDTDSDPEEEEEDETGTTPE